MFKMPWLYRIGRLILGPIFKWYYHPTIIGANNIPEKGAIIIASNHIHLYDQCMSIVSTKRFIRFMAKKEYFDNKKVAWFFKHTGCISVDRAHKDKAATDAAISTLKNSGAIGIFPEGTRNKTKELLLPFKYGAVSMAKKTDAYIIPCCVTGHYKFRSKDLLVRYGKKFKVTDLDLEEANKLLYENIKSLMEQNIKKTGEK